MKVRKKKTSPTSMPSAESTPTGLDDGARLHHEARLRVPRQRAERKDRLDHEAQPHRAHRACSPRPERPLPDAKF
jgi:hypothetical protein